MLSTALFPRAVSALIKALVRKLPKTNIVSGHDKLLTATDRTHDQWAHAMIVSPSWEIVAHNLQVRRRNHKFAIKKGLA